LSKKILFLLLALLLIGALALGGCAPEEEPKVEESEVEMAFTPTASQTSEYIAETGGGAILETPPILEPVVTEEPTEEPTAVPKAELEYISQEEEGASFGNDCASAGVLMVARYYGVAGDETVDDIQYDMIGCNCFVPFDVLSDYLRTTYGLDVEVVVTFEPIIPMLSENKYDTSGITVVDDIPHDVPVIWSYNSNAHWVVRFEGWNYDPIFGKYLFSETKDIYKPELGLGLIVTQPEKQVSK
jgi:hypothetical protein